MDKFDLVKLGLNQNEAKVYVTLVKQGSCSAGELIKKTKFHRNIVYDNLEKLIDKGLVSYILEGHRKIFKANPAISLTQMLDKEQEVLNSKKQIAKNVQNEVQKILSIKKDEPEAIIFRGKKGLKVLFEDTLRMGNNYIVFGAPLDSLRIMGEVFWKNYNLKRETSKIEIRMIFNDELRNWSKNIQSKLTKIKFLSKKFDSLSETMIYSDKVAIIIWGENPIATLIKDKNLANSYRQYFEILWKEAKK